MAIYGLDTGGGCPGMSLGPHGKTLPKWGGAGRSPGHATYPFGTSIPLFFDLVRGYTHADRHKQDAKAY
jgi:hypothetical protein